MPGLGDRDFWGDIQVKNCGISICRAFDVAQISPTAASNLASAAKHKHLNNQVLLSITSLILDASSHLEHACLPPGQLHFRPISKLCVEAAVYSEFHLFNEVQVDDLASIGPKETIRIETPLQR